MQYRTTRNYKDGAFLGPRIGDKIFMGLLVMTLYLNAGNNFAPDNIYNIAAVSCCVRVRHTPSGRLDIATVHHHACAYWSTIPTSPQQHCLRSYLLPGQPMLASTSLAPPPPPTCRSSS